MTVSPFADLGSLIQLMDGLRLGSSADDATVKGCCAAAYGVELAEWFLGRSYHPGGVELTRHLADALNLRHGQRVLDVASGIGTTSVLLALERGVDVLGIDLGERQTEQARRHADAAQLEGRVRFEIGDAERLPVDDDAFDAVICECAFCTFPDKGSAAAEFARAVRPGGRVGITDVWLDPTRLDPDLAGLAGRVACLADARPINELCAIVESAGLRIDHIQRHDDALAATIDQIVTRLRALRLIDLAPLRRFDLRRGIELAKRAAAHVQRGDAGYLMLIATKPT